MRLKRRFLQHSSTSWKNSKKVRHRWTQMNTDKKCHLSSVICHARCLLFVVCCLLWSNVFQQLFNKLQASSQMTNDNLYLCSSVSICGDNFFPDLTQRDSPVCSRLFDSGPPG